ncbi:MAG TPA: hypothetical protein IGS17_21585 [Oscillatoriales cyanobacterium M59_W2019_021]|nr:hypothetical protein [Oscillatoriales cyanobacterium M4454_W2019_049]HIK53483.1 hypothetical protein [Oscillatoriales cyanobacterium M59_W2019_021]
MKPKQNLRRFLPFDRRSISIVGTTTLSLLVSIACHPTSTSQNPIDETSTEIETANPSQTKTANSTTFQSDPDVNYLTLLSLIKGQLRVAKELLVEGKADRAEPHIVTSLTLYGDLQTQLKERNVPELEAPLQQLYDLVKSSPDDPQVQTEYKASMEAIDTAIAAIPSSKRQSAAFGMAVIDRILEAAKQAYETAISDEKMAGEIEYQDAQGLILYANELYPDIAESVKQQDRTSHREIEAYLEGLTTAFPSDNPPETPAMSSEQFAEMVDKIAENARKLE